MFPIFTFPLYFSLFNLGLQQILAQVAEPKTQQTSSYRFPIVYVYTVVPRLCSHGLPLYIKTVLEQSIFSQPDCDTILASNFAECKPILDSVQDMPRLIKVDTTKIVSARTTSFLNASGNMFDTYDPLWVTSALRFFIMEDIMITRGYKEMMHVEADNMLYGPLTTILDIFRKGYHALAATPLNDNKSFITASVVWIASLGSMIKMNDYFLALGYNTDNKWKNYLKWLRPYACCKHGGVDADENGRGIKPFAINEMSMLAYYHEIHPEEMNLLPVVPAHNYNLNRFVCNMSRFGPGGPEVGPATGHGIWDANSWGQFIGGTNSKKGRDIGFTDSSHISGQAIRMSGCAVTMQCGNNSLPVFSATRSVDSAATVAISSSSSSTGAVFTTSADGTVTKSNSSVALQGAEIRACYTAPFVKCGDGPHTPLWNLHVHSKHTLKFKSSICPCANSIGLSLDVVT
jgi:hypothetical protein